MCMWKKEAGKKINYPFTLVLEDLFIAQVFKYLFKFNLKYIFKAFIDPYCAEKSSFFVCRLSESGQDPDPSDGVSNPMVWIRIRVRNPMVWIRIRVSNTMVWIRTTGCYYCPTFSLVSFCRSCCCCCLNLNLVLPFSVEIKWAV